MKGMIFTEFLDMVEARFGLAVKNQIIRKSNLSTDGAYTTVGNYDHTELVRLITALSEASGVPVPQLLEEFGGLLFGHFTQQYGQFFTRAQSCFEFLAHIEGYIHVEVRKLYPDAELPAFTYPTHDADTLVMEYRSPRPLGMFAKGLVQAAIEHFKEPMDLKTEELSGGQWKAVRFTLTRRKT